MSIQPNHHPMAGNNDTDIRPTDADQGLETSRPNDLKANDDATTYSDKEIGLARDEAVIAGEHKFKQLGWKRLTICLIVKAIALGALSIPSAFASVGMVAGVILTVGIGLIAIYTSPGR